MPNSKQRIAKKNIESVLLVKDHKYCKNFQMAKPKNQATLYKDGSLGILVTDGRVNDVYCSSYR